MDNINMSYNMSKQKDIILKMQKCQRNWDYSKTIPEEVQDYLLWIAQNSPSKQHEAYYDVYWTSDRDVIQEYSRQTWGNTYSRNPPACRRNSQANANMYILFVAKESETTRNTNTDGSIVDNKTKDRWENAYVSVGIAMGLVMQAAQSLGLSTGCNKSHGGIDGNLFWPKKLGIEQDLVAGTKKITYGIGIGYPQENKNRWDTDEHELVIGASNGTGITTLNEDDHIWVTRKNETLNKNKKFRKVKIIDITTCDQAEDPYGNIHQIPNEIPFKTHSHHERKINLIEIK